jgi:hypothetical protein
MVEILRSRPKDWLFGICPLQFGKFFELRPLYLDETPLPRHKAAFNPITTTR